MLQIYGSTNLAMMSILPILCISEKFVGQCTFPASLQFQVYRQVHNRFLTIFTFGMRFLIFFNIIYNTIYSFFSFANIEKYFIFRKLLQIISS